MSKSRQYAGRSHRPVPICQKQSIVEIGSQPRVGTGFVVIQGVKPTFPASMKDGACGNGLRHGLCCEAGLKCDPGWEFADPADRHFVMVRAG